jgi:hypothetical protein
VKDFLKKIRSSAVELIEVSCALSDNQISVLIQSEFEMTPLFPVEINTVEENGFDYTNKCLVLCPRLIIMNPLSVIVTRLDCPLEMLHAFERIVFYVSSPHFSNSLEALQDQIRLSYKEEIKHGITKISLTSELLVGRKRQLKIICNSGSADSDVDQNRPILI